MQGSEDKRAAESPICENMDDAIDTELSGAVVSHGSIEYAAHAPAGILCIILTVVIFNDGGTLQLFAPLCPQTHPAQRHLKKIVSPRARGAPASVFAVLAFTIAAWFLLESPRACTLERGLPNEAVSVTRTQFRAVRICLGLP